MSQTPQNSSFFIAIGPEKTGTTWLYENLKNHPEIKLNRIKEIRFLWEEQYIGKINLYKKLFGKHWHLKSNRTKLKSGIRSFGYHLIKKRDLKLKELLWEFKFFFGKHNGRWYRSLFDKNAVTGDITPKYCELDVEHIKAFHEVVPDAKIIISLRDPIERQWSWLKMSLIQHRGLEALDQVSQKKIDACINDAAILRSNDYVELYERWKRIFGSENILVIFYDELKVQPEKFIGKVERFLGIEHIEYLEKKTLVNKGVSVQMPNEIRKQLIENNRENLEKMRSCWVKNY